MASLPDPSWKIRQVWGFHEDPNIVGGPYARNVTPIVDTNTTAGRVKGALKLCNPLPFCIVYPGPQADGTDIAQTPLNGCRMYFPLDDIIPPPAEDIIDYISEESDDDGETRRQNRRSFPTSQQGLPKSELGFPKWTAHTDTTPHSPQIFWATYFPSSTMLRSFQWCDHIIATPQNVFSHLSYFIALVSFTSVF